jgi:hypothetical protein
MSGSTQFQSQGGALYSLADIQRIKNDGFEYELPAATLKIVNELAKLVGSPTYVRTPQFKVRRRKAQQPLSHGGPHTKDQKRDSVTAADWQMLKSFKTTAKVVRTDVEQVVLDLKSAINKISAKNYETQVKLVVELVNEHVTPQKETEEEAEADQVRIVETAMKLLAGNKFYSEMFTKTLKAILSQAEAAARFQAELDELVAAYPGRFDTIVEVNPETDYDGFCANNLKNENLLAASTFLVNLMKCGVLPRSQVATLTEQLLEKTEQLFSEEGKSYCVEVMTDNVFVLVKEGYDHSKDFSATLGAAVDRIRNINAKSYPSLNNKILFKYMDLGDAIGV